MAISTSPYFENFGRFSALQRPVSTARAQQEAGMDARTACKILRQCSAADIFDFKYLERSGIELEARVVVGEHDRATRGQQFTREREQAHVIALHVEIIAHALGARV